MDGFKKAYVDPFTEFELPSKKQLQRGFKALRSDKQRSLYLFFATSGLRRGEVLSLAMDNIDTSMRCVKPKHVTRTKKAGVSFYNQECERYLRKYLATKEKDMNTVFPMRHREYREIWDLASEASGFRITAQVLRRWFSTEMGELMVPDRFTDIFQGRAPRSILAKFYTGRGLQRLKRIYDKAGLKVLS